MCGGPGWWATASRKKDFTWVLFVVCLVLFSVQSLMGRTHCAAKRDLELKILTKLPKYWD